MKLRLTSLFIAATLFGSFGVMSAQGYDDDDIYYNPSKAKKQTTVKKQNKKSSAPDVTNYPAADTYIAPATGTDIDVDTYNRRGIFANDTVKGESNGNADFAYTRRIEKFYNPDVVTESNDEEIARYYYAEPANVNITIATPGYWGYPYYGGYYNSPWYWGYTPASWYYNSWAWGPSWSWGWGPSWSWGWGPSWGWAPSRPIWSHRPIHNGSIGNVRPGYRPGATGHMRPGTTTRPGNSYRPGNTNSGYRPGNSSGYRPGRGNSRNNNNSHSRPSNNSNNNNYNYNNGYRGNSRGSSIGSYGGGSRGGSIGGSRGGGGGRGRH